MQEYLFAGGGNSFLVTKKQEWNRFAFQNGTRAPGQRGKASSAQFTEAITDRVRIKNNSEIFGRGLASSKAHTPYELDPVKGVEAGKSRVVLR